MLSRIPIKYKNAVSFPIFHKAIDVSKQIEETFQLPSGVLRPSLIFLFYIMLLHWLCRVGRIVY